MTHILVHYSIRDGENEYSEYAIVETDNKKLIENVTELFKKFLIENYGAKKEGWKPFMGNENTYELPNDYRLVKLEHTKEIDEETKNTLHRTGVAYSFSIR